MKNPRPIIEIKNDLKRVQEALGVQKETPCIKSYLAKLATFENLKARLRKAPGITQAEVDRQLKEAEGVLRAHECDTQIANYKRVLGMEANLKEELKIARDMCFLEKVRNDDHVFCTGIDGDGHTKTICLGCHLTSDITDFADLSETVSHDFAELHAKLFTDGKAIEYYYVTGFFETIEEAREYYQRVKELNFELEPKEIVPKMLQLKGINVNYIN